MAAPSGNKNALKHGLYAKHISRREKTSLGNLPVTNLESEIHYLRSVCMRLSAIIEKHGLSEDATKLLSKRTLSHLSTLDAATAKLLDYVKVHALLVGELTEFEKEIEQGKLLSRVDMNVYDYFTVSAPDNIPES